MPEIDTFFTQEELKEIKQNQTNALKKEKKEHRNKILKSRAKNEKALEKELPPLPNKRYQLIYIDPPWRYEFSKSNSREIENQYPTMEIEDIKNLPIEGLAEDNSVLFLWATSPKLEEAIGVINAYGFKYVTSGVWDKQKIGMGYYFRSVHEHLLIGKKGNLPVPAPENRVSSIISIPRRKHSQKPIEFYKILETMYPNITKIEIFSRIKRDGWDAWGFEAGLLPSPEYVINKHTKILGEEWEL